jgi:hypothetical protein
MHTTFWSEYLREETASKTYVQTEGQILYKYGVDWIQLAQDRIQLRALFNMIMKFQVP